jgi:hypothetical protein
MSAGPGIAEALWTSNQHSPIADLEHPFAFSDIANAQGCSKSAIGEC